MITATATDSYELAIGSTAKTITTRTARFRKLITTVIVIGLAVIITAAVATSWSPLAGLVLIVPVVGSFFWLDARLVNRWQQEIVKLWVTQDLKLGFLAETLREIHTFPAHTLEGMLQTLPLPENIPAIKTVPPLARAAIAATLRTINYCQINRTASATVAGTMGLASLSVTIFTWSWTPLGGLFLLPACWAIYLFTNELLLRRLTARLSHPIADEEYSLPEFIAVTDQLDWGAISPKRKTRLLDLLRNPDSPVVDG